MDRRRLLLCALGGVLALKGTTTLAARRALITVYKNPSCGCCGGWVAHMQSAGFDLKVIEVGDLTPHRRRLGIPDNLASCHTAEVGGYSVEGHVPAVDVRRLLRERPNALGLAVPGMVPGSPGMSGTPVPYATLLVDRNGRAREFERH
jgi:hypothetical protein